MRHSLDLGAGGAGLWQKLLGFHLRDTHSFFPSSQGLIPMNPWPMDFSLTGRGAFREGWSGSSCLSLSGGLQSG